MPGPRVWSVGITANPCGVGASGASREKVTGRCSCCGLLYWYERWPGGSTGPDCEHCLDHVQQPDEPESTPLPGYGTTSRACRRMPTTLHSGPRSTSRKPKPRKPKGGVLHSLPLRHR